MRGLLRLTLLAVLSWQAAGHSGQSGRAPPTYEELSTSLILNQLAIMQLMHDSSNASCGEWLANTLSSFPVSHRLVSFTVIMI